MLSQTAQRSLNGNESSIFSEAMHVHFDKDIYLPGETIWFKAYIYNTNMRPTISTNFYTIIYDENGKLLQQKLYPIIDGVCNGDFMITDTILSGKVQFTAFTKAMLLSDSNAVFKKTLSVYKKENQSPSKFALENNITLQFFPEGGNWVAGINNHIAYKAWYNDGSPAQVSGKLFDEDTHTEIDSFSTNKLGLGKFQIIPELKSYTALWKGEDGKTIKTKLPVVNADGIVLHAELVNNELYYVINKNSMGVNFNTLHLLAQKGGDELYKADIFIGDKKVLVNKFSIDSLPSGIIQLTLFDNDWNPLQERIVFIDSGKNKNIVTEEPDKNRSPKTKNTIAFMMPDTLSTNLSVSIADINFYNNLYNRSIKQDLWFTSQLRGLNSNINEEIENRNTAAIDLIMLTHGWRKYNWKNIIKNEVEEAHAVDNYLSVHFNYNEKNYALPKGESLSLIIDDSITGKQFYKLSPNSQTSFIQDGIVFYDSAKIYYQLTKNKELIGNLFVYKNEEVKVPGTIAALKANSEQGVFASSATNILFDTITSTYSKKFNNLQTLKEVIVKEKYVNPLTKRILQLEEKYTSGLFRGISRGYQLDVINDKSASANIDIYSYLKYRIPAILTVKGGPGFRKFYPCTMLPFDICDPVLVFINESEMPGEMLETVPLSTIAYVKYTPGIVIGSSFTTKNGALYVYTKKGDEESPASNSIRSVRIKGYDLPKEFFNPDYADKASLLQPDLRTTLYWNPYIITDKKNNKIKIEYYNNDISKKLLLTIEGINEEGKLIHFEKIIE